MKTFSSILAMVAATALVAHAADNAGSVDGMLPTDGTLKRGAQVRLAMPESFKPCVQELTEALQKLAPEKRDAFVKSFTLDQLPEYDKDIWPSKEAYDRYAEEWRKLELRPVTEVAVGLEKSEDGTWSVLSATVDSKTKQQVPLTIGALRYDANRNVWISNNGELTAKDYSMTDASIYGAQIGTEWSLEKKDSLSHLRETLRLTKTIDGKYVYLAYSLVELSSVTGRGIAQGAYLLRFPQQTGGANLGTPGQR